MKNLFKALLIALPIFLAGFIVGQANAEILATLPNQAGGTMYFTDSACSEKNNPYWKIMYSTYNGGQTTFGCWFYADGMVHVEWTNGKTSAFDARELNIRKKKEYL